MAAEESQPPAPAKEEKPEVVYKTKVVEFLGRSTPIILQNDNGPCPLLAICNVLLLRNGLHLNADVGEVTQEKLLSLVAEKLLDANSNIQDKDDGYVSNQQQNIADAIDLLPRLATGIDVNVLFRKINDFEFTSECAIFDLLDIGLYHGWILDPQDKETVHVIGSKSYNALVSELVAFDTGKWEGEGAESLEEDCVDFVAATTATLGVPSPTLSRDRAFDGSPVSFSVNQGGRKGDVLEMEELMKVLTLSRDGAHDAVSISLADGSGCHESSNVINTTNSGPHNPDVSVVERPGLEIPNTSTLLAKPDFVADDCKAGVIGAEDSLRQASNSDTDRVRDYSDYSVDHGSECLRSSGSIETLGTNIIQGHSLLVLASDACKKDESSIYTGQVIASTERQSETQASSLECELESHSEMSAEPVQHSSLVLSTSNAMDVVLSPSESNGLLDSVASSLAGNEPIYEGEECIHPSVQATREDCEPVYEGEVVIAEQADKADEDASQLHSKSKISRQEWQLIKNFLEQNASQLTIYGLFSLQEGLKERELGVFFRNNHFSTIFKLNGELYLLATDQGYINQPDLVWEKLNEVNGDTVFMTSSFKEFKLDNPNNDSWNEQSAMDSTAEYLASLESSTPMTSTINSDLQLAIALQQQEFQQQPQPQQQQNSQQTHASGRSRLITGPQVPTSRSSNQHKSESKLKEKCNVM